MIREFKIIINYEITKEMKGRRPYSQGHNLVETNSQNGPEVKKPKDLMKLLL